jgi:hypothetical protein
MVEEIYFYLYLPKNQGYSYKLLPLAYLAGRGLINEKTGRVTSGHGSSPLIALRERRARHEVEQLS